MSDAVFEFMAAGEQGGARGRTGGTDVEIGEAHALGVKGVEVRRFQDGILVGGKIAVALIVGEDEKDVGTLGSGGECNEGKKEGERQGEKGAEVHGGAWEGQR